MSRPVRTSRRAFLRTAAVGLSAAAIGLRPVAPARGQLPFSRILEVESETVRQHDTFDSGVLRRMVSEGVRSLIGARADDAAWKRIVAPNDVVAIKIDAAVPQLSTHKILIDEIVRGVVRAGVPPENVIVWDRYAQDLERFGYALKALPEFGFEEPRGRILASEGGDGTIRRVGYDENIYFDSEEDLPSRREDGATVSYFSQIVTQLATRIICLPVLRYHPITGIYGCLAGLALGSMSNTFRFHPKSGDGITVIADIWRESSILREKHALTIVDGLSGAYNTGPGYDPRWFWSADRLFVSRDPVAADTLSLEAVNGQRKAPLDQVTDQVALTQAYVTGTTNLAMVT